MDLLHLFFKDDLQWHFNFPHELTSTTEALKTKECWKGIIFVYDLQAETQFSMF